jgi:hypothetical protein
MKITGVLFAFQVSPNASILNAYYIVEGNGIEIVILSPGLSHKIKICNTSFLYMRNFTMYEYLFISVILLYNDIHISSFRNLKTGQIEIYALNDSSLYLEVCNNIFLF